MLKYDDYISDKNDLNSLVNKVQESTILEPKIQEPKVQVPEVKEPQVPKIQDTTESKTKTSKVMKKQSIQKVSERIVFTGKIVSFNNNMKPSKIISLLESKNISKDKLNYILTEQENSIVLLKYNTDAEIKLKIFTESLLTYNSKLNHAFENIEISGNNTFVILTKLNAKTKQVLIQNIKTLLK